MEAEACSVGPAVLVFEGEYDFASKEQLRKLLERYTSEPRLVLDFTRVTFLDSTCVTELLRLHACRGERHLERETIVLGETPIRRLFEVLDLYRVFRVVSSIDEEFDGSGESARIEVAFSGAA